MDDSEFQRHFGGSSPPNASGKPAPRNTPISRGKGPTVEDSARDVFNVDAGWDKFHDAKEIPARKAAREAEFNKKMGR